MAGKGDGGAIEPLYSRTPATHLDIQDTCSASSPVVARHVSTFHSFSTSAPACIPPYSGSFHFTYVVSDLLRAAVVSIFSDVEVDM
jgi:hypothetical protein